MYQNHVYLFGNNSEESNMKVVEISESFCHFKQILKKIQLKNIRNIQKGKYTTKYSINLKNGFVFLHYKQFVGYLCQPTSRL